MTRMSDEDALRLLREAMPAMNDVSPATDLWPHVRRKVQAPVPAPSALDWLLLAATVAACVIYPSAALVPLLHF